MSVADEAFGIANWKTAEIHYAASRKLLLLSQEFHRYRAEFLNKDWHDSINQVVPILSNNVLLTGVHEKHWDSILVVGHDRARDLKISIGNRALLYYVIALAAKHMDEEALEILHGATKLDSHNGLIASFTRLMEAWIQTPRGTTKYAELSNRWLSHGTKKYALEPIFSDLWLSRIKRHGLSDSIKNSLKITRERCLLRHLGFMGDPMSEILETDPVDQGLIEDFLKDTRRQRAKYPPGTRVRIEIREFPKFMVYSR